MAGGRVEIQLVNSFEVGDPLARFLVAAKQDVRTATMNSREWNTAGAAGGRRTGGTGLYWYPID